MKLEAFPKNERDCSFTYVRTREGPNGWISYYKGASTMHVDPLECWRVLGVAKFTDTGKALRKWAEECHERWGDEAKEEEPKQDAGFFDHAPEPNDNTKMVT
jgi:hypothetical protein